jgi:hypothetical protein
MLMRGRLIELRKCKHKAGFGCAKAAAEEEGDEVMPREYRRIRAVCGCDRRSEIKSNWKIGLTSPVVEGKFCRKGYESRWSRLLALILVACAYIKTRMQIC